MNATKPIKIHDNPSRLLAVASILGGLLASGKYSADDLRYPYERATDEALGLCADVEASLLELALQEHEREKVTRQAKSKEPR